MAEDKSATQKREELDPALAEDIKRIGKRSRKQYEELKRRVIKAETNNRQFIIVLPCDGDKGWCEVGDVSALLYKYEVCGKLNATTNLTNDEDRYYTQFTLGRIRTRGFETIRRRLKKTELYAGEQMKDGCMFFKLKKKFSDDEIKYWTKVEQERQDKINNITKVSLVYPALYREIAEVMSRLRITMLNKLDRLSKNVIGERIFASMFEITKLYYEISEYKTKKETNKKRWRKINMLAKDVIVDLQILGEQGSLSRDFCAEMGVKLNNVASQAERYGR